MKCSICALFLSFVFSLSAEAAPPEVTFQRGAPAAPPSRDEASLLDADFRYSPPWWQVAICLPDDWQKTLVSKEGALLYDYPGDFSGFGTRVSVSAGDAAGTTLLQKLQDPRIPIVETTLRKGGEDIARWRSLSVVPGSDVRLPSLDPERVTRVHLEATTSATPLPGWGSPGVPCIDSFRNIVAGFGCDIGYRFRASATRRYSVAFGFMESHHAEPGKRVVDIVVEGKSVKKIDLIKDIGRHRPGVLTFDAQDSNGDGYVSLSIRPAPESEDKNPILNVLWVFPQGKAPSAEELIKGGYRMRPLAELDCGGSGPRSPVPPGPPRGDLLIVERSASGGPIRITVDSRDSLAIEQDDLGVYRAGTRFLTVSSPWEKAEATGKSLALTFPAGVKDLAVYCASGYDAGDVELAWARAQEGRAAAWWAKAPFPYGKIRVPDRKIQALIDASIRNIYQAREVRDGLPIFQVGPTCYRGLWIVDGTFILEAMTYLGLKDEARAGIEYLLRQAKPDGSFEIIKNYWKENGIVLYLIYRHALLTQDWAWLAEHWYVLENLVRAIQELRVRSRIDPALPEAGLMPPGFPDGGIGGCVAEYTNVYWNLVGLRAAVQAARFLGRVTPETFAWEAEYESFLSAFRDAAKRDARKTADGKLYLPILMKEDPAVDPVRGQWAFCHAVHPGQIFEVDDPLALGNMALLDAHASEGLVLGTGWMADGIWNYFASFYGHAHLWLGNGTKAAQILYAFANHSCPLLVWREEQHPSGKGSGLVGDMPHNWASAEFIRLVRNLIVLERGDELHLLEGLPRTWLVAGGETALEGIATDFGPISLKLSVAADGTSATVAIHPPVARPPRRIVVHLGSWAAEKEPNVVEKTGGLEVTVPLSR